MNILLQLFSFCLGKYREVKLLGQRLGACLQETASLFYSGPGWMGQCSPALVRGIFFPQSIDLNAHLFWNHPHRHAQNNVLTAILVSFNSVKLTHSINHHKGEIITVFIL